MTTAQVWILVIVIVVVLLLIVGAALLARRRSRTAELRSRFGPEYDRTIASSDRRSRAEAELAERARRRADLHVVPLPESSRLRYADEWRVLQERFVDRPGETVGDADLLLQQVMRERGYPTTDFEDQAAMVSVDHPDVVDNYRVAHRIYERNQKQQATTEELREAVLRYRALFDSLLHPSDSYASGSPASTSHAARTRPDEMRPDETRLDDRRGQERVTDRDRPRP